MLILSYITSIFHEFSHHKSLYFTFFMERIILKLLVMRFLSGNYMLSKEEIMGKKSLLVDIHG